MRKRAEELGGRLEIDSSGNGTKLILILPRTQSGSMNMLFGRRAIK
jgi:signal transduction histidine kinase